ncbi:MAG: hypothetical protein U0836_09125 [Pirellulales bacterium]
MKRWLDAALPPTPWGDLVRFAGPFLLAALFLVPWFGFQGAIGQIVVGQFWTYSAAATLLVTVGLIVYRTVARRRRLREWGPLLLEGQCVGQLPLIWFYSPAVLAGIWFFYSLLLGDLAEGGGVVWAFSAALGIVGGMTLAMLWWGPRRLEMFERGLVLAGYWGLEWSKVLSVSCARRERFEVTFERPASPWRPNAMLLTCGLPLAVADRVEAILADRCPQAVRVAPASEQAVVASVRRQFQLKHAFWATLPAAVFFALIGPWFRRLEPSGRLAVLTFWGSAAVCTAFYFWIYLQARRGVLRQWGEPELALRQPKTFSERYRTLGCLLLGGLCLLFYTFISGPLSVRHSLFQRLFMGVPTGTFLGMALAALWFDELLVEVFPRALVLGERRVFPFQLMVGYDLQKREHLELNVEYIPAGKLGGGNSYVEIRLPPDRGDFFAALLEERCPGIGRTRHFRNRHPETTEEPDGEDEF